MKEMVGGCCVCSDERGWPENPLVYCDGSSCTVAVHQACYGIVTVPTGPWYCRKCESNERSTRVRCELCPSRDGALKKTDSSGPGWAHVVCALYIPEVRFGNVTTMEPIILQLIPPERYAKTCYICQEASKPNRATVGACMQCNKSGCKQQFHVTCAQALGLLCEEAGNYLDNVKYCGYCQYHYSKLKKGGNVKPIPPYKPQIRDASSGSESNSSPEKELVPPPPQPPLGVPVSSAAGSIASAAPACSILTPSSLSSSQNLLTSSASTSATSIKITTSTTPSTLSSALASTSTSSSSSSSSSSSTKQRKSSNASKPLSSSSPALSSSAGGNSTGMNLSVNSNTSALAMLNTSGAGTSVTTTPTNKTNSNSSKESKELKHIKNLNKISSSSSKDKDSSSSSSSSSSNRDKSSKSSKNKDFSNDHTLHSNLTESNVVASAAGAANCTPTAAFNENSSGSGGGGGRSSSSSKKRKADSGKMGNSASELSNEINKDIIKDVSVTLIPLPLDKIESSGGNIETYLGGEKLSKKPKTETSTSPNQSSQVDTNILNANPNLMQAAIKTAHQHSSNGTNCSAAANVTAGSTTTKTDDRLRSSSPYIQQTQAQTTGATTTPSLYVSVPLSTANVAGINLPTTTTSDLPVTNRQSPRNQINSSMAVDHSLSSPISATSSVIHQSRSSESPNAGLTSTTHDTGGLKIQYEKQVARINQIQDQEMASGRRSRTPDSGIFSQGPHPAVASVTAATNAYSNTNGGLKFSYEPQAGASAGSLASNCSPPAIDANSLLPSALVKESPPSSPGSEAGSSRKRGRKSSDVLANPDVKVFQNGGLSSGPNAAPHMLGNQLNPASKLTDQLRMEIQDHSIFNAANESSSIIGVPFPGKLHSGHRNLGLMNAGSNTGNPIASMLAENGPNGSHPQSLEELLERQWENGSRFLMDQAQHFDIATLLSCLYELRTENARLEDHVNNLKSRRDHLLALNARLQIPLSTAAQQNQATLNNLHLTNGGGGANGPPITTTLSTTTSMSTILTTTTTSTPPTITTTLQNDVLPPTINSTFSTATTGTGTAVSASASLLSVTTSSAGRNNPPATNNTNSSSRHYNSQQRQQQQQQQQPQPNSPMPPHAVIENGIDYHRHSNSQQHSSQGPPPAMSGHQPQQNSIRQHSSVHSNYSTSSNIPHNSSSSHQHSQHHHNASSNRQQHHHQQQQQQQLHHSHNPSSSSSLHHSHHQAQPPPPSSHHHHQQHHHLHQDPHHHHSLSSIRRGGSGNGGGGGIGSNSSISGNIISSNSSSGGGNILNCDPNGRSLNRGIHHTDGPSSSYHSAYTNVHQPQLRRDDNRKEPS